MQKLINQEGMLRMASDIFHKYGNVSAKWQDSLKINSVQFGRELLLILEEP